MPIKFTCPTCLKQLSMPESAAGKTIRCPACADTFPCPSEDDEIAEDSDLDEEEDEPKRRTERVRKPNSGSLDPRAWGWVLLGLKLITFAFGFQLVAVLLAIPCCGAFSNFSPVFGIFAAVAWTVGCAFCLAAPPRHNARALASAALGTTVLVGIILAGSIAVAVFWKEREWLVFVGKVLGQMLAQLLSTVSFLFFLGFLRAAVVPTFKEESLGRSIRNLMIFNVVALALNFVGVVLVLTQGDRLRGAAISTARSYAQVSAEMRDTVIFVAVLTYILILNTRLAILFWYTGLLWLCRDTIEVALKRQQRPKVKPERW